MRYNEHKDKKVSMMNCSLCKGNGFHQVKIPSGRKPYCCSHCWEAIRRKDDLTWDQITKVYEDKYGRDWYDDWPLE